MSEQNYWFWSLVLTGGTIFVGSLVCVIYYFQLRAMRDSVDKSAETAEAARDNVEMVINKERARLRIEMRPLELRPPTEARLYNVSFSVHHHGPTVAFITDTTSWAQILPSGDPLEWPTRSFGFTIPTVIEPNGDPVECYEWLCGEDTATLTQTEIDAVHRRESFVYFCGSIRYRDVFGKDRETKFRYRWEITDLPNLDGSPFAHWAKVGGDEDNKET